MSVNEKGHLGDIEKRSRKVDFLRLVRENPENWRPAPQEGLSPVLPIMEGLLENGFSKEEAVDLYALKPNDLIYFTCTNFHAFYTVKIGEENKVTVWRDWGGKTTGLTASRDDLVVVDQNTMTESGEVKAYPGFLFTQGFQGMKPRISMPYFAYDDAGRVKEPLDAWMDFIKNVYVKRQNS